MALYDPTPKTDAPTNLARARALIERGWLQNRSAVDANGRSVTTRHPNATSFCVVGAVSAASGVHQMYCYTRPELEALRLAAGLDTADELPAWNDAVGRTQAEVVDLFRRAEGLV